MPDELRVRLGSAAFELGLNLQADQLDRLLGYLALLVKWNRVYNLTAVRDPNHMLSHHLIDCMAVAQPLMRTVKAGAERPVRLLDVGSGAGLPGAVLGVVLPSLQITCIDAVGKKASFLRQVAGELSLSNLHVEHGRVETADLPQFDVVASRAFSSLSEFTVRTKRLLLPSGVWMAMKARRPDAELTELHGQVDVFHVEPLTVPSLDAERCIVWMRPVSQVQ